MNTHTEIARITEELRALYLNDNDAPRLIAEMLEQEFPESLDLASKTFIDRIEELESAVDELEAEVEELESSLHGE